MKRTLWTKGAGPGGLKRYILHGMTIIAEVTAITSSDTFNTMAAAEEMLHTLELLRDSSTYPHYAGKMIFDKQGNPITTIGNLIAETIAKAKGKT